MNQLAIGLIIKVKITRHHRFRCHSLFFLRLIEDYLKRHTADREASCMLHYNCVEDIRWRCVVRSGLQRRTHTMLMATVPSGSCWR